LVIDVRAGIVPRCDVYVHAELDEELTQWMSLELAGAI